MSTTTKKIPDMFLKALKRKSEVMADATNNAKQACNREISVKEASPKPEDVVPVVAAPPPSDGVFSLFSLLKEPSWQDLLKAEFDKKYMRDVESFLEKQYKKNVQIFPQRDEIFSAFNITKLEDIKVVVIGQDPYHDDGQAHGLSFSVKPGVKAPPSLKNIYKELGADIPGFVTPTHGYLMGWARQGVFMLNASLTVEAHKANSHAKIGWQTFTDNVIKTISKNGNQVVFVLWGGFAQKKEGLIDTKKHAVIKTAHPSPLSARHWWGNKCFSQTNTRLEEFGKSPIDWNDLKLSY